MQYVHHSIRVLYNAGVRKLKLVSTIKEIYWLGVWASFRAA